MGRCSPETRVLLGSFQDALTRSVRLLLLVLVRALLSTGVPLVRQGLDRLGLGRLLAEAEEAKNVEDMMGAGEGEAARPQAPLLPPRHESDEERLTIVLDLDETLVCAYNTLGRPVALHEAACKAGIKWFTLDCVSAEELDDFGLPKVHNVTVYQRPGLKEFLAAASQLGELVLFTAGLEGYAKPLVDRIDPEGRITHRLYRSATVSICLRDHVKDLSLLGRPLRRTVLVDNNPFSFLLQPENGIPCVAFTGEDTNDQQLQDVLLPLLEHLSAQQDVRPHLLTRYHMPTWFRIRGVPVVDASSVTVNSPWVPLSPVPAALVPPAAPLTPLVVRDVEGVCPL